MTDDFAPDGQLAKAIPGFKPREPQRQMAVAVTQAIEKGQPLVVEAGTGTGKTYAYLAPALRAKKKVVLLYIILMNTMTKEALSSRLPVLYFPMILPKKSQRKYMLWNMSTFPVLWKKY